MPFGAISLRNGAAQPALCPRRAAELAAIEAYVARHGVRRSVDFGADQPAVDVLKAAGWSVARLAGGPKGSGKWTWLVGAGKKTTADLWAAANRERAARGLPALRRPGGDARRA